MADASDEVAMADVLYFVQSKTDPIFQKTFSEKLSVGRAGFNSQFPILHRISAEEEERGRVYRNFPPIRPCFSHKTTCPFPWNCQDLDFHDFDDLSRKFLSVIFHRRENFSEFFHSVESFDFQFSRGFWKITVRRIFHYFGFDHFSFPLAFLQFFQF